MAVAYASHNSLAFESDGGTTTMDITKPTSLAEGDLMVFVGGGAETIGAYTKTGWTQIFGATATNLQMTVLFKVADSSDAAASTFDFGSAGASGSGECGALFRITGNFTNANNFYYATASGLSGVDTSVTPLNTSSLLLLGAFTRSDGSINFSTFAIANNNPTWTERVDITALATRDADLGIATATPSAASATGNSTIVTTGNGGQPTSSLSFLISIHEDADVTGTHALLATTPTFFEESSSAGVTGTHALHSASPTFTPPTATVRQPTQWQRPTKPSTTWVNKDKL